MVIKQTYQFFILYKELQKFTQEHKSASKYLLNIWMILADMKAYGTRLQGA